MRRGRGIGTKTFAGFISLVAISIIIGGAGYITLSKVNSAGRLNVVTNDLQTKVFEARIWEKDYIIKKDDESFNKLAGTLNELEKLTDRLRSTTSDEKSADEIAATRQAYRKATEALKTLEVEDAAALVELQAAAKSIETMAGVASAGAYSSIKEEMLKENARAMKDNALKRIKDIVGLGYDVISYYQSRSQTREAAFDAIRSLHFEGDNYFFVVQEDLTVVAHGSNRKLEGQNFGKSEFFDKKSGKSFMKEVTDGAMKSGESYTEYYWPKPGMGESIFPKVTYAKYFKPWGLIVCAGVYIDDIEKEIADSDVRLKEGLQKIEQAGSIGRYILEARLNALYWVAFNQRVEKVKESVDSLKHLPLATADLQKEADLYLVQFNRRISNSEKRRAEIARIDESAAKILKLATTIGEGAQQSFTSSAANGRTIIQVFILVGIVSGLVFATMLTRTIVQPVKRAVSGIEEASDQVASASRQVSATSQQLAEGSSEQAASLEETSSALEQMASMTKMNATNAGQANQLMKQAGRVVQEANQSMELLTDSMRHISQASEETQKIIRTIDEIAFQTNLLALNAAVEAARAGEAGAGFAVVADEVRNLAMRAAEAAKNTASLIEGTVKSIQEGSVLVDKTNQDFQQVAETVEKSGELIGEIAVASEEQSQGIEEINRAVSEMDKVTQQNAANAEQSAAASAELNAQAEHMRDFVEDLGALAGSKADNRANGERNIPVAARARRLAAIGSQSLLSAPAVKNDLPAMPGTRMSLREGRPGETRPERTIPMDDGEL